MPPCKPLKQQESSPGKTMWYFAAALTSVPSPIVPLLSPSCCDTVCSGAESVLKMHRQLSCWCLKASTQGDWPPWHLQAFMCEKNHLIMYTVAYKDASLPCFCFPMPQSNAFLLVTDLISCILSRGNSESWGYGNILSPEKLLQTSIWHVRELSAGFRQQQWSIARVFELIFRAQIPKKSALLVTLSAYIHASLHLCLGPAVTSIWISASQVN